MKKSTLLITLLTFMGNTFPTTSFSQSIDWIYEITAKEKTIPQYFWVDENGTGYYNISIQNPDKPGDANYGSFLLMLDNEGQYKRTTMINDCHLSIKLLPFGKNKLLSSGYNCSNKSIAKNSRLFDYKGNILKTGSAFPGNYFASIHTDSGFTFFSKPTNKWGYSGISIGTVDKNLDISHKLVSIKSLRKKDLGIVNSFKDPALTENGTWVIPMQYGKVNSKGTKIGLDHGVVFGVKETEIIWSYPKELINYTVQSVCGYKNRIGVLMSKKGTQGSFLYISLDQNGVELDKFRLRVQTSSIKDMIINEQYIIILGNNGVFWFDKKGNLMHHFNFSQQNIQRPNRMQLLKNNSIIFTARRNKNAIIIKISPEEKIEEGNEDSIYEDEDEDDNKISFSSIDDELDNTIISVSVYPNPASSFINFEFGTTHETNKSFIIQIFNASGQLLITDHFNQNIQSVNVQNLSAGTYVYSITTNDNQRLFTGQFVKVTR